jgi:hypothetical protein
VYRTAVIGYCLAQIEGRDADRTASLCLFHDPAEARTGDHHALAKRHGAAIAGEDDAWSSLTSALPAELGMRLNELRAEYVADATAGRGWPMTPIVWSVWSRRANTKLKAWPERTTSRRRPWQGYARRWRWPLLVRAWNLSRRLVAAGPGRQGLMLATVAGLDAIRSKGLALDITPEAVGKLLARYHLFQQVLTVPGNIVEAGVYRGAGLFLWAGLLELFAPRSKRRIVGFDTFTGFPENLSLAADRDSVRRITGEPESFAQRTAADVQRAADLLGVGERLDLVPGDAVETIPAFATRHPGFRIALLHLDFDVYEPTRQALDHLYPLVVPGGVVALDHYGVGEWGESDAVDEFLESRRLRLSRLPWGPGPWAYFVKP